MTKRNDGGLPVPLEGVAETPVTRARAIKLFGAMGAAGAFAAFTGGTAEAGERDRRRRRRRRRRRIRRQRQNNVTTDQSTVNFGDTTLGAPVTRTVEVTNDGNTPVTIDPQLIGDGFTLLDTDPIVVDAGETRLVDVVFNPLRDGVSTGTLRLVDARDGLVLEVVDLVGNVDVL